MGNHGFGSYLMLVVVFATILFFPVKVVRSQSHQDVWIPTWAILYGRIGEERPGKCYPVEEAAKFSLLDISQYLTEYTTRWCSINDTNQHYSNPVATIKSINPKTTILVYQFSPAEIDRTPGKAACGGKSLVDSLKQVHGQGSQDVWFALGYNTIVKISFLSALLFDAILPFSFFCNI